MRNRPFAGMIAALAVALAAFSATGEDGGPPEKKSVADSLAKAVSAADTSTKAPAADTSSKKAAADSLTKASAADTTAKRLGIDAPATKAAADSLAKAAAVDSSAGKPVVDSLTKAAAGDTSAKTAGADSSAMAGAADTAAKAAAAADTATRADLDSRMSVFDEFDGPFPSGSGFLASVAANLFYVLFFGVSLAVIAATLYFYLTRRDTRRFMTTTRLSVLDRMVQKGCRYVESNYSDPSLTVADVCGELVTGEAYLDVLFEKELGITVKDFITQVRVNNIKNTLAATSAPDLEKICAQCGFPDRATAERMFAGLNGGTGIAEFARALYREKKS